MNIMAANYSNTVSLCRHLVIRLPIIAIIIGVQAAMTSDLTLGEIDLEKSCHRRTANISLKMDDNVEDPDEAP